VGGEDQLHLFQGNKTECTEIEEEWTREKYPVSLSLSQEGCFAEVLASILPLGILHAHAEGGRLWRDQREAERVRERWREPERDKEDSKNREKVRATGRERGERAQQPMVGLRAAAASRAGVQQTEEKHVCPRGRDWKTGSKSRQGNLHDTHCIKATRLI